MTADDVARASHLLANYLHNEDGAQDEWLEEAYEIVARLASQPAPAVEGLDELLDREVLPLIVGTEAEVRAGLAVLRLVKTTLAASQPSRDEG